MKKAIPLKLLMVILVMALPLMLLAQPGFGDDVDDVPVDGGLSFLLAAGVGYGIRKCRKGNKPGHAQKNR